MRIKYTYIHIETYLTTCTAHHQNQQNHEQKNRK